jgi:hypothetical protein
VRALVAVDLDQTVVFSERAAGASGPRVVVEHLDGAPLSSMTRAAHASYAALAARAQVVPVTTRTVAQYARVVLPVPAALAVCANGGVLLVDGVRDAAWDEGVRALLAGVAPLASVRAHLERWAGEDWVRTVRTAEELFVYLVAEARDRVPEGWVEQLAADLDPQGWRVSVQGRKVYAVPAGLSKGAAVQRLRERLGAPVLLAAGDSLLDASLLELALASGGAVRPAHGELHDLGWAPDGLHVTVASGARAGEELLDWLTARVGAGSPAARS